jgi:hypothetical protein
VVARICVWLHDRNFVYFTLITDVLPPCGSYPLVLA